MTPSTHKPVRWGVLGAARIAIAKTIPAMTASDWCIPYAIGARDLSRARAAADQVGVPRAYGSYDAVLADPEIEAVYIALPNHVHVEWALKAARAGKHVLCEKPIALNAAQAEELRNAPGNLKLSEAFMVRQQPRWAKLREILRSGKYGAPKTVQMLLSFFMSNPGDFRRKPEYGGGAVYDLGCYTVMTSRYVFESEPRRVTALAEKDVNGVDVLTTAMLDFGAGRHASFTVSTVTAASQTLHVVCEQGLFDLPRPYVPAPELPSRMHVDTSTGLDDSDVTTTEFPPLDQYRSEVTNFSKAIRGDTASYFGIDDAVANMRVIDALFASIESGQWEDVRVA